MWLILAEIIFHASNKKVSVVKSKCTRELSFHLHLDHQHHKTVFLYIIIDAVADICLQRATWNAWMNASSLTLPKEREEEGGKEKWLQKKPTVSSKLQLQCKIIVHSPSKTWEIRSLRQNMWIIYWGPLLSWHQESFGLSIRPYPLSYLEERFLGDGLEIAALWQIRTRIPRKRGKETNRTDEIDQRFLGFSEATPEVTLNGDMATTLFLWVQERPKNNYMQSDGGRCLLTVS